MGRILISITALVGALFLVSRPLGGPSLIALVDPVDGMYSSARQAAEEFPGQLDITGLGSEVTIEWEQRGVPHIFAASDSDAVKVLGNVVARDRLFQIDFVTRVAAGRLSELFGSETIRQDKFLRETGMEWGAQKNLERIQQEKGIEWDLLRWYAEGINSYVSGLTPSEYPLEYRLLGLKPRPIEPIDAIRLLQYMSFDLSYNQRAAELSQLAAEIGPDFELLYPRRSEMAVPIVRLDGKGTSDSSSPYAPFDQVSFQDPVLNFRGYMDGKGSNNWAVGPSRSETGQPILAGDMHLSVTLPAIWYEAHIVTPSMNAYGVTIPGAPLLVEAFTDSIAWAYTNSGTDQIDQYIFDVDRSDLTYQFDDDVLRLETRPDTILVRGADPVIDTLYYSHWGPTILGSDGKAIATKWTAHGSSRTLEALWGMLRAGSADEFRNSTRKWDVPMQNILLVDRDKHYSIVSTGFLPDRPNGNGWSVMDGTQSANDWKGRVPFDQLPTISEPSSGYVTSTNQEPVAGSYPHYQGRDWRTVFRSQRIDQLLSEKNRHSVEDLKLYQSDVKSMQFESLKPYLHQFGGTDASNKKIVDALLAWDGRMDKDLVEPLLLDLLIRFLEETTWDETVFQGRLKPHLSNLFALAETDADSRWFDLVTTDSIESAIDVLAHAIDKLNEFLVDEYGGLANAPTWGDEHRIVFKHVTQTPALRSLWRGPYPFPGYNETLSPGVGREVTFTASWRVVVDMSGSSVSGFGVYPGGQSGHPLHKNYDSHLQKYLDFEYYELHRPSETGLLGNSLTTIVQPDK